MGLVDDGRVLTDVPIYFIITSKGYIDVGDNVMLVTL